MSPRLAAVARPAKGLRAFAMVRLEPADPGVTRRVDAAIVARLPCPPGYGYGYGCGEATWVTTTVVTAKAASFRGSLRVYALGS